jgi:hypothetical protein
MHSLLPIPEAVLVCALHDLGHSRAQSGTWLSQAGGGRVSSQVLSHCKGPSFDEVPLIV